jgi:hypothetical protein
VDRPIILKQILEEQGVTMWTEFSWLRTGMCKPGEESSRAIQAWNFSTT